MSNFRKKKGWDAHLDTHNRGGGVILRRLYIGGEIGEGSCVQPHPFYHARMSIGLLLSISVYIAPI